MNGWHYSVRKYLKPADEKEEFSSSNININKNLKVKRSFL